ncbi:DUF4097 family beta strand repeat-containing protein [Haloglycomyces albus]|uniref:DUF4097 family beta strand repeat-containing protein n=1 Tax=Haloglycomyces albus TaxID=526067 RepID=UPI00046CA6D4|nr:DUF4097 family beta strand repeat-containing protein [Haloglycomyces albus]
MNEYTEFEADGPITASITLADGSATVTGHDSDTVFVEIRAARTSDSGDDAADLAKVDFDSNHLRIVAPEKQSNWFFKKNIAVHIDVKVPFGSDISLKSASAPLYTLGRMGPVAAHTAAGQIEIEQAQTVRATTASGSINIQNASDDVRVNTASGSVDINHVGGELSINTVSGTATVYRADSSIKAKTVSGSIDLEAVSHGVVNTKTVSGSIDIGVVPGTDIWMDLDAKAGSVISDLAAGDTSPRPSEDGKNVEINARSLSGDIHLHRSVRA